MQEKVTECLEIATQELKLARQYLIKEIDEVSVQSALQQTQFNQLLEQRLNVQSALETLRRSSVFVQESAQIDSKD